MTEIVLDAIANSVTDPNKNDYRVVEQYLFKPIRCSEEMVLTTTPINGAVYFTTDTQKVFLGVKDKILQMCENKGFFYGTKEIIYDNSGNNPDPNVDFFLEEIEGGKLPEKDDLILNVDGCFYRVLSVVENQSVNALRLTLQGTGGGGSSDGGVSSAFAIYAPNGRTKYFASNATQAIIDVAARSSDVSNFISSIELSFDSTFATTFYSEFDLSWGLEIPREINLAPYLNQFSEYAKILWMRVTDKYGIERTQFYTISLANLKITSTQAALFDVHTDVDNGQFDYTCNISGTSGLTNKKLTYSVIDKENIRKEIGTYELNDTQQSATKALSVAELDHGSYTLVVQATGYIGGNLIPSNELTYKLIVYNPDYGTPIFSALVPNSYQQYLNIEVPYLLTYGDDTEVYPLKIYVNNNLEAELDVLSGKLEFYSFNFDFTGAYTINYIIDDLGISESYVLTITKYAGSLPVIKVDEDDLKIYLTAKKRTNTATDKDKWPDYKDPTKQGDLYNFYYKNVNGWLPDEDGNKCLVVNQGGLVEYKGYYPFATNPKTKGLTIELDFKVSGILDYNARLIECLSYQNAGNIYSGFYITGNKFCYYASGQELMSIDLVEGKRTRLAFVIEQSSAYDYPMCFVYINGHMSGATCYGTQNIDLNDGQIPAYFRIVSAELDNNQQIVANYGSINLYNYRVYNTEHNAASILYNYQADLSPLEIRQSNYNDNLIRDDAGNISLSKIESGRATGAYRLNIPYVKITGGYLAANNKDMTMGTNTTTVKLPTGKKDYRSIDMEIYYPTAEENPYFTGYPENFIITTTFEDENLNVLNGFGKTPITGAVMYAQGTSSLEYPVKNLRVKMKGKEIRVRPDLEPVNLICFKADYMDSSGSHNTGASNFIDDAYAAIGIETPGQKHYKDEKIVTCIKGHPCIIFWSPDGVNYEYIGKYNLNLDKATPEPFGFKNDDTNFGYEVDENGELVLDENGNKKNSIYCFEFLDNAVPVCNFKSRSGVDGTTEQERYYNTWYGKFQTSGATDIEEATDEGYGWTFGFESRYPEDKIGMNDADHLYELASWLNELYDLRYNQGQEEEALWRFKDEYQLYLDKNFTLAYYCITETLLMADSRVKNMMIATWGPEKRTITRYPEQGNSSITTEEEIFKYIWYPIFYDMDTMLGLDNTGVRNKEWYAEDTSEDVFNGDEILWKFVRDALPAEVATMYRALELNSQMFTKDIILPYFNTNQANMANETMYNEDAYYKYLNPFRNGYQDDLNNKYIAPGTGTRLYAIQGDRSLMREFFLTNRLRFLRGKYSSSNYKTGDRIEFRVYSPKAGEDEKIDASLNAVPPSGSFEITSIQPGYAGVMIGANGVPVNVRFNGRETTAIAIPPAEYGAANGTETYLLGASNLSDIGDLSNKYLQNFIIASQENKLEKLKLGSEKENYYNPYWGSTSTSFKTELTLGSCPYLKEFDFRNCSNYVRGLDFSSCPQIQTILATGSGTTSIILPVSGVITELRLPSSISILSIESHPLEDDGFTLGKFNYITNKYENDFSLLNHIRIVSTPIDSYAIVKGALRLNNDEINSQLNSICIQDFAWEISDTNDFELETTDSGELKIIGIKVLDKLVNIKAYNQDEKNPIKEIDKLIGTIKINVTDLWIDEYELYEKYHAIYPNVDIECFSNNIIEAYDINFYSSQGSIVGKPYYTVKSSGVQDLSWLISANGPNKEALPAPNRTPDVDKIYRFSGVWTLAEGSLVDINNPTIVKYSKGATINQNDFIGLAPKEDISFTANYIDDVRTYTVILLDDDDNGNIELLRAELPWEADIGIELKKLANGYRTEYNYKAYTGINEHSRYTFKGWQSDYDRNNNATTATYDTLDGKLVTSNFIAYAFYKEEDARYYPTPEKYFKFVTSDSITVQGVAYTGQTISIKDTYRQVLQDKITLPSKYEEKYISFVGNMRNMTKITSVYFLEDNQYIGIKDRGFVMGEENILTNVYLPKTNYFKFIHQYAFANCYQLISIDISGNNKLNDNIVYLGDYCFSRQAQSLDIEHKIPTAINYMKVAINELPASLTFLGNGSFYPGTGGNDNIVISMLPDKLQQLPSWSLAFCKNVNISNFGTRTNGGLSVIYPGALRGSGQFTQSITIYPSIVSLGAFYDDSATGNLVGAFTGYGNISRVTTYKKATEITNTSDKTYLDSFYETGIPENAQIDDEV